MIDCHIHIYLDGIDFKKSREIGKTEKAFENVRKILRTYKSKEVYVLRDGGDNLEISSLSRKIAKEEGIILKSPVYALYKKGKYGSFLGKGIEDIDDFKKEFKVLKSKNIDHLKIVLSGIVNFNKYNDTGEIGFREKELTYMVNLAKDNGAPTMIHVNSIHGIDMAINAGSSTIEHGYFITERQLYSMAEKGIIWVPTLAPLGNLVINNDIKFKKNINIIKRIYEEHLRSVKKAYDIGAKMAIGSDSGCYGVLHGQGTNDEINHFVKAGIPKEDVIKMGIENGMKACNLTHEEIDYVKNKIGV